MKHSFWLETIARTTLWGLSAAASFYGLLCYLPFTWTNFIADERYPAWFHLFLKGHGWFLLAIGALGIATLTRKLHQTLFGILICGTLVWAFGTRGMLGWGNQAESLLWSLGVWLPYGFWEFLRLLERPRLPFREGHSPAGGDSWEPFAFCAAGLLVWIAMTLSHNHFTPVGSLFSMGLVHVIFFLMAWSILEAIRAVSSVMPRRTMTEWLLTGVVIGLAFDRTVYGVILNALDFRGTPAHFYAALWALAMLLAWGGAAASLFDKQQGVVQNSWAFWMAPLARPWKRLMALPAGMVLGATCLLGWPWVMRRCLIGQDWNRLLETLSVMMLWVLSLSYVLAARESIMVRLPPVSKRKFPVGVLLLAWGIGTAGHLPAVVASPKAQEISKTLREWSESDLSFQAMRRMLARQEADTAFFKLLHRHTNLPRDTTRVDGSVRLGSPPARPAPSKPNIFIFVVDSLRPDYLGAYNPSVRFTPSFDALAKDAFVFKNAFSIYGATGLSEPSIWAGAHLPHLQYPKPFHPFNALEQLIKKEFSRRFITRDVVLTDILEPTTPTDTLDSETDGNYRMCGTLQELTGKLKALPKSGPPIFVYSQPQDIHISVLENHPPAFTPADPKWKGFHAPYAARIAEIDACFGQFVAGLKNLDLYDNSIIVLTSDHGDSMGEEDRWGHAYTIYPEILQVPMIWRIPAKFREGKTWDVEAPAFLIDLTPTLYALLEWSLTERSLFVGRPLFSTTQDQARPPDRVMASSYGPVYGVLSEAGRRLYIADAIHYTTRAFQRDADGRFRSLTVTPGMTQQGNARIEKHLSDLAAWFRITQERI